jgi:ribonuclease-3
MLYRRFPLKKEGEMTRLKSTIVSRNACRRVALRLGLDKYILIGKTLSSIPDSLVSNVMEAVIGAIFLDGGFEEARLFIEENFQKEVATALNVEINRNSVHNLQVTKPTGLPEDYKTILQTLIQKEASKPTYKYVNLEEIGPSHSKCFKYAVEIDEKQYQAAWGKSKKEAQQRAAGNAIHQIQGQEPIFDDQLQK